MYIKQIALATVIFRVRQSKIEQLVSMGHFNGLMLLTDTHHSITSRKPEDISAGNPYTCEEFCLVV